MKFKWPAFLTGDYSDVEKKIMAEVANNLTEKADRDLATSMGRVLDSPVDNPPIKKDKVKWDNVTLSGFDINCPRCNAKLLRFKGPIRQTIDLKASLPNLKVDKSYGRFNSWNHLLFTSKCTCGAKITDSSVASSIQECFSRARANRKALYDSIREPEDWELV